MPYSEISQQLDARHFYFADVHDVAHYIQSLLEPVLLPPEAGLYLPGQLEPVLRAGQQYWYEKTAFLEKIVETKAVIDPNLKHYSPKEFYGTDVLNVHQHPWQYYTYEYIPVTSLEQVMTTPWDVVDVNPDFDSRPKHVVLPRHLAGQTSLTPTMPVAAIRLIMAMIQNEIEASRLYQSMPIRTVEELLMPFVRPEYMPQGYQVSEQQKLEHLQHDRWFQQTSTQIFDAMMMVLAPIRAALRQNGYLMCSVQYHDAYNLRIDQMGDYRIFEWEKLMSNPEFRRWKEACANGTWTRFVAEQEEARMRGYALDPNHLYS